MTKPQLQELAAQAVADGDEYTAIVLLALVAAKDSRSERSLANVCASFTSGQLMQERAELVTAKIGMD